MGFSYILISNTFAIIEFDIHETIFIFWQSKIMQKVLIWWSVKTQNARLNHLSFTGKREAYGEHIDRLEPPSEPMAEKFRKTLRFPIYVHSKMMIVDDAYIIVGSANINQRSMAGMVFWAFFRTFWLPFDNF